MFKTLNDFLKKITKPTSVINIVLGLFIGLAHVFLALPTLPGLILGCFLTLTGSYSVAIGYFFTSAKTADEANAKPEKIRHTLKTNLFLALSLVMLVGGTAASFMYAHTGMLLLLPALALAAATPVAPGIILAISLTYAIYFSATTLMFAWLQIHYLWQTLCKEAAIESVGGKSNQSSTGLTLHELEKDSAFKSFRPSSSLELLDDSSLRLADTVMYDKKIDKLPPTQDIDSPQPTAYQTYMNYSQSSS